MADRDVHVSRVGDEWVVTIEGLGGFVARYESRRDAVEAGRRVAQMAVSKLRLDFGGAPGDTGKS